MGLVFPNSADTKYINPNITEYESSQCSLILILCPLATINEYDAMSLTLSTKHQQCCLCRSPPYYGALGSSQHRSLTVDWDSGSCSLLVISE